MASFPASSSALEGGDRAVVGFYAIDFSYEPRTLKAGDGVTAVFQLTEAETSAVKFSHVVLRVEQEHVVKLSGKFLSEGNRVSLTKVFDRAGTYTMNLQFFDGERELVGYSFPLVIQETEEQMASTWDVVNISEANSEDVDAVACGDSHWVDFGRAFDDGEARDLVGRRGLNGQRQKDLVRELPGIEILRWPSLFFSGDPEKVRISEARSSRFPRRCDASPLI